VNVYMCVVAHLSCYNYAGMHTRKKVYYVYMETLCSDLIRIWR